MSGVYIYEISPRDNSGNIVKIGASRYSIDKRIEDSFNENFSRENFSYYKLDIIPCNYSLAINMENYLINSLADKYPDIKRKGRELFYTDYHVIKEFIEKLDQYVLKFFKDVAAIHTSMQSSIGCLIRSKRKIKGWTQTDLSEYCNLRQATISEIENGKIGNYSTLKIVCDVVGIKISFY